MALAVQVKDLSFHYDCPDNKVLKGVNFDLPSGARCLLVGENGSGKSTLLRLLSGLHIHERDSVKVLGCSAFYDTPQGLTYLGSEWKRSPSGCSVSVPLLADIKVADLVKSVDNGNIPAGRKEMLIEVLDVDLSWRLHQASDGQRRRAQILVTLLKPFSLLLLDEVTIDLDVLVRHNLMEFLRAESETTGATIVYATHIFDGLNEWPTHIAHMSYGQVEFVRPVAEMAELHALQADTAASLNSPLLRLVFNLLREGRRNRPAAPRDAPASVIEQLAEKSDKFYNYWG